MRIASLSPAATEILFALGIGKQIVCTDQFSNFPEEAKAIPHVQDHVKVNLEELQQYKPEAKELIARMHKGFQEVKKKAKVMREGRDVRIARLYIEEWPAVAHTTGAS